MKRYSISYFCNQTKRFDYRGRTDNPTEVIERYKNSRDMFGLQIRDSETKQIIFSEIRPIKGKLTLTLKDGSKEWISIWEYVDLSYMRQSEHEFLYNKNYGKAFGYRIVKVEREIYR